MPNVQLEGDSDSEEEEKPDELEEEEQEGKEDGFEKEDGDENLDAEDEWLPLSIDFSEDEGLAILEHLIYRFHF